MYQPVIPPRYEDEYPEDAKELAELCEENAERKRRGEINIPIILDELPELANPIISGEEKVGRNDKCPCGSGKKFKKCCMNK